MANKILAHKPGSPESGTTKTPSFETHHTYNQKRRAVFMTPTNLLGVA